MERSSAIQVYTWKMSSTDGNQAANLTEEFVADATDHQQVFRPFERPVLFAMGNDSFRERRPDSRQVRQFIFGRLIDINRDVLLIRRG